MRLSERVGRWGWVGGAGTLSPDALVNSSGLNLQPDRSPAIRVPSLLSRIPAIQRSHLHLLLLAAPPPPDLGETQQTPVLWGLQAGRGPSIPCKVSVVRGEAPHSPTSSPACARALPCGTSAALTWLLRESALPIPTFAARAVFSPVGLLAERGSELWSARCWAGQGSLQAPRPCLWGGGVAWMAPGPFPL